MADELIINPRLEVTVQPLFESVVVRAPVKGEGLRTVTLTDPALFPAVLLRSEATIGCLSAEQRETLRDAGVLVTAAQTAATVLFRAVPPAWSATEGKAVGERWLQHDDALPPAVEARVGPLPRAFAPGPVLWFTDPARGWLLPSWFDAEARGDLEGFVSHGAAPQALLGRLRAAGAWAAPGVMAWRSTVWRGRTQRAAVLFGARGFATLRQTLPPFFVEAVAGYLRALAGEGYLTFGDSQSRRYHRHNEPVVRFIHHQLTGLMASIAGRSLKPSYCFVGAYEPGADLKPHRDREQCEYTMSMQIDYRPTSGRRSPWALWVTPRTGAPVGTHLGAGDVLLYRGRELSHYRHVLPDAHWSTSIFLHYVNDDFVGSLD